ncbi:MAG: chloride channel protein, partial [Pseudomonadota bacterium]|nr:chloride channel protein [Pseudomonadota bacterium]
LGTIPYQADRFAGQTLRAILSSDFVIAPATNIMNSVITRMNNRNRSCAIIVSGDGRIPRPDDVVGVVDSKEIAGVVVSNHYG